MYVNSCAGLIYSDKNIIRNILFNLISNAIKFSDLNSTIQIQSEVKNGITNVCVADEGMGISAEDKEHLFSSFFRGKNATNIQGTGLGLHIVKRYVELLGGSIQLDSVLNKGTMVWFSIPLKS